MRAVTLINAADGVAVAGGAALVAGATYYAELNAAVAEKATTQSMHWIWDASIIATITIEMTNHPTVSVTAAAASGWDDAPPPTISILGGSAAQDNSPWINVAPGRLRAKIVVGGTGGVLDGYFHGKV